VPLQPFEDLYAAEVDPWRFATSPYETAKYDAIIEHLADGRYDRCFEPGCAIGVLTARLADLARQVVACDPSPSAIAAARRRVDGAPNVELVVASLPEWWPDGTFDLIVLSDIGYYWDRRALRDLIDALLTHRRTGGTVVAAHWLGRSDDHLLGGDDVHQVLIERLGRPSAHCRPAPIVDDRGDAQQFVLDRWDDAWTI
jgi:SAM-dependent methyltransferase